MRPSSVTTAEQLLRLDDRYWRHELVRGELRTMSLNGDWHGAVCSLLAVRLGDHVHTADLGTVWVNAGFVLARKPDTVLAPDIAFVHQERLSKGDEDAYHEGPPDLAIEVQSPRDSRPDVERRAREWLDHGCRGVWIVDLAGRSVTVLRPDGSCRTLATGRTLSDDDLVPGFAMPVREIFIA